MILEKSIRRSLSGVVREFKCPTCDKKFTMPINSVMCWVYKDGSKRYCSWTCYRSKKNIKKGRKNNGI